MLNAEDLYWEKMKTYPYNWQIWLEHIGAQNGQIFSHLDNTLWSSLPPLYVALQSHHKIIHNPSSLKKHHMPVQLVIVIGS